MRIALGISYNGKNFYGWQKQPKVISIQTCIEQAIKQFCAENISLIVAGRTDAGVHALEQVVHFDTTKNRENISWVRGLNGILHRCGHRSIVILWACKVEDNFHARFSASSRSYHYVLYANNTASACFLGQVGYLMLPHGKLNIQAMQQACNFLLGKHDFSSFRASLCQANSPIKTMYDIKIQASHPWYIFSLSANAFLYHMVRNIVGCLIKVGINQKPASWIKEILDAKNRQSAAPTFMPDGLYLAYIDYPNFSLPQTKPKLPWQIQTE
jgi:tRNA pseudouridine38-40 synthase